MHVKKKNPKDLDDLNISIFMRTSALHKRSLIETHRRTPHLPPFTFSFFLYCHSLTDSFAYPAFNTPYPAFSFKLKYPS